MISAEIKGYGSYLPERVVTNFELQETLDTNDEWIVERTGIKQRHIAAQGELTSDLGAKAASAALANSGLKPEDIDLLILATTTPDDTMPSTATKIQHKIGMKKGAAFDINAACAGFVYALTIANNFIRSGSAKRVLVVGAETYSRIIDWNDRSTAILFGDGAGILFSKLYSDGEYHSILNTTGGVSSTGNAGFLTMHGKEVFRHAVAKMSDAVLEGLLATGLTNADIDWVIPHQANVRILQAVGKKLNIGDDRLISTVANHANTSAASIPLAFSVAYDNGKLKSGHVLAIPALGAGLTWGACIIRL